MATCTLVPQGGCSGSTPACDIHDDGATYCRGVTSQGTSNNHCTAETECKQGYSCIDDGAGHPSWCARFCESDNNCTGTGSRCIHDLQNANGNPIGAHVCSNACDPYALTGCPTGMSCQGFNDAGGDFSDCVYIGSKTVGTSCTLSSECAAGLLCVNQSNVSTCRKLCVMGNSSTCPSSQTCTGFTDPLTIGTVTYGACD